ncbi:hypothetical protein YC2023_062683 [Brassica napus]
MILDPLPALIYAVQVMKFLKKLIVKTLKDRKESRDRLVSASNSGPRDENGDPSSRQLLHLMEANKEEGLDTFEVEMKDKEESAEEEEEYAEPREILGVNSSLIIITMEVLERSRKVGRKRGR